jgi:hypothetical protein
MLQRPRRRHLALVRPRGRLQQRHHLRRWTHGKSCSWPLLHLSRSQQGETLVCSSCAAYAEATRFVLSSCHRANTLRGFARGGSASCYQLLVMHRCRGVLRQLNLLRTADGAWGNSDALLTLLAGLKDKSGSEGGAPQLSMTRAA